MRRIRSAVRGGACALVLASMAGCSGGGGGGGSGGTNPPEPTVFITACDPIAQTGCSAGKKCAWVRLTSVVGALGCVPDGTVALDGACRYADGGVASGTGYDDCRKGLACRVGTDAGAVGACAALCSPYTAGSCTPADQYACTTYSGLFQTGSEPSVAGLCDPQCDPITQARLSDGAAACGSPDPASPTRGCYGTFGQGEPSQFTCSGAGPADMTDREPIPPPAYLNSCAPGYAPLLTAATGNDTAVCIAYCQPADTTLEAHATPGGVAPHDCQSAGGGATAECRYWWWMEGETTPATRWSNGVGFCFDYTYYRYDTNRDGVPDTQMPSCTTLSATAFNFSPTVSDAEYWGCVAQ